MSLSLNKYLFLYTVLNFYDCDWQLPPRIIPSKIVGPDVPVNELKGRITTREFGITDATALSEQ
jgi:hypothetical protein